MLPRSQNRIGKACALVAATLILPGLAYAQSQNGTTQNGTTQNGTKQNAVPDGGPGIVLIATTVGAILVFSARQSFRKKAQADSN